jgi:hypothetical protein
MNQNGTQVQTGGLADQMPMPTNDPYGGALESARARIAALETQLAERAAAPPPSPTDAVMTITDRFMRVMRDYGASHMRYENHQASLEVWDITLGPPAPRQFQATPMFGAVPDGEAERIDMRTAEQRAEAAAREEDELLFAAVPRTMGAPKRGE